MPEGKKTQRQNEPKNPTDEVAERRPIQGLACGAAEAGARKGASVCKEGRRSFWAIETITGQTFGLPTFRLSEHKAGLSASHRTTDDADLKGGLDSGKVQAWAYYWWLSRWVRQFL